MQDGAVKKKVSVIPVKKEFDYRRKPEEKRLKVAAYCRVSTGSEEQETSYEAQVDYYTKLINSTPNWKLTDIYADEGISGTGIKKRTDLQRMIEDCEKGKIDYVLVKSISRLARNTVDSLNIIRKLKELNIAILFEKEGINTLEAAGELLITILSSQAQEESRNTSENVRWGYKRGFESGKVFCNNHILGYRKNSSGELEIDKEGSEVVKRIFKQYLEGCSLKRIAKGLTEDGITTSRGNERWHDSVIMKILKYEKYMGDLLQQKTLTVDYLTKKRVVNHGIAQQYYVENNHEAIIPRELFFKVQEEILKRSSQKKESLTQKSKNEKKGHSKYILSTLLECGECGQPYRRLTWVRGDEKQIMWRCYNRVENGTKYCKHSATWDEKVLQNTIMNAIYKVSREDSSFNDLMRQNIVIIMGNYADNLKGGNTAIDDRINKLEQQMIDLIKEGAEDIYNKDFLEKYERIGKEIQELKREKLLGNRCSKMEAAEELLPEVQSAIHKCNQSPAEFDETLVGQIIERIKVINENRIEIVFKSGTVVSEEGVKF